MRSVGEAAESDDPLVSKGTPTGSAEEGGPSTEGRQLCPGEVVRSVNDCVLSNCYLPKSPPGRMTQHGGYTHGDRLDFCKTTETSQIAMA